MKYDVIIIGAGLGGLTAGAKLAKDGKKVLMIEQHTVPGGCATTFKRKDFIVEAGLHEMDGLDDGDPKRKIFRDLGVFDHVEFVRVPDFYRFTNQRIDIVIPDNPTKAIDVLVKRFPRDEKGIRKFFGIILNLRKELNRYPRGKWKTLALLPVFPILYPNVVFRENQTVGKLLDSLIHDEDLKLVLLANLGYYHDNPYTMSLLTYALAQASYFIGGGHYIKGGSQKLSDYLASVIKNNGGEVILRHLVTGIITEDNKAVGVKYRKTSGSNAETQEAFADYIVANAAIPNVVNELLPPSEVKNRLASDIAKQEIACSLTTVYLGFKKPPTELGNKHYSTIVFSENMTTQSEFIKRTGEDWSWSNRGFAFVDYSQIDSRLAPQGKGLGVICTSDYLSDWENLSKEEYKTKKEEVARILTERLNKVIPGIKDEIEYCEVSTPKTIKRYTLNPQGTAYGFAQIPKQAGRKRIRHKSPIDNLYFASAWTYPAHGFTGTILGGYWCAEEILDRKGTK
jgi:phytoene dehydrogenase-like protein